MALELLDAVEARRVTITAFIVGSWLDANPDLGWRMAKGGHELANHTYTHPSMLRLGPDGMASEVIRCRDTLRRVTGDGGRWFRPSGTPNGVDDPGTTVRAIAGAAGYPMVIGYDVDPADYQDPGPDAIARRTLAAVRPGSIISLHFGHPGTIRALPAVLDGLSERRLRPVGLSALLRS